MTTNIATTASNVTTNESIIDKIVQQMPLSWLPLPITSSTLSDVAQQTYNVSSFDQEWQNLRFLPWRFFYLDYQHLNQELNSATAIVQDVTELIQLEWNKVYDFYMLKVGQIERKIQSYYYNKKQQDDEQVKLLILDIHQLYHFAKLNYSGFLRLFMQYDRLFGPNNNNSDLLRRMLINKPFWDHSIVLFDLVSQLNHFFCTDLFQPKEQQIKMITMNPTTDSFFSAVESIKHNRQAVHPLSISSSSSSVSSILSCETALSHQQEDVPKHSSTVKKYWVHPDNILEVMLLLSNNKMVLQDEENNPSLTFTAVDEIGHPQGNKSKLIAKSPTSIHHVQNTTSNNTKKTSRNKVTTVYFDTPNLNGYTERVVEQPIMHQEEDDSNRYSMDNDKYITTRVRWYNNKLEQQDGYSLIEDKVHYKQQHQHHYHYQGYKGLGKKPQKHDKSKENYHQWIKQRTWLKSKHLKSWIHGSWSFSNTLDKSTCQYRNEGLPVIHAYDKQRMKNACLQTERDIHNKLKVPVLKTTHDRHVYISNDHNTTISIDTDIVMMRPMDTFEVNKEETTKSNHRQNEQESHPHYPYYNTTCSNDITRFPYCVIQVEQRQQDDTDWLMKLESSPLLEPVHNFSLFLHGVGTLLCDQVHVFPSWLSKIEFLDIRQCTQRGKLLIQPEQEPPVVIETVSTDDANYWSSNTIATIVTCYDDNSNEGYVKSPLLSSSSSSISSLLSPTQPPFGKFRRSFDSYCSFDHPTSSKSDPTNCKSCMGRMINNSHSNGDMTRLNNRHNNADCPTLYSVVRDAFRYCFGKREGEKEPLISNNHHHNTHYVQDIETGNAVSSIHKYQSLRTSVTTAFLIILSLSVSYLFYVSFINK